MKFGKRLRDDLAEVGWENHYTRYKLLKTLIKFISHSDDLGPDDAFEEFFPGIDLETSIHLCYLCKGWSVFVEILREDVKNIHDFLKASVNTLLLLNHATSDLLDALLRVKQNDRWVREPIMHPKTENFMALVNFLEFAETISTLQRFIYVNEVAIEKIIKKFKKMVLTKSSSSCGKCCVTKRLFATRTASYLDDLLGKRKVHMTDSPQENLTVEGNLSISLHQVYFEELQTINSLETEARQLESKVMVECSTFYDFLIERRKHICAHRQQEKINRIEAGKRKLERLAKYIDIESYILPSQFLLAGIFLPIITFAITYGISSTIHLEKDAEKTILEERGYYISTSIDLPPASSIGSLGLGVALFFLRIVILVNHIVVKKQLRGRHWILSHRIAAFCGLFSTLCGNGVAVYSSYYNPGVHSMFAASFFLSGLIYIVLETMIDKKNSLTSKSMCRLRIVISSCSTFCQCGFFGIVGFLNANRGKELKNKNFLSGLAAFFEIVAFVCFLVWFLTCYPVFKASRIKIYSQHHLDGYARARKSDSAKPEIEIVIHQPDSLGERCKNGTKAA